MPYVTLSLAHRGRKALAVVLRADAAAKQPAKTVIIMNTMTTTIINGREIYD
jgi:hypothetical protein